MARRLALEEKALWSRVMATVKPLVAARAASLSAPAPAVIDKPKVVMPKMPLRQKPALVAAKAVPPLAQPALQNTLDSTWDRRIHKGGMVPDISVDLHETTLSGAYARLDRALEQAIHQKLRVMLLVTGHNRAHDRASGQGRGAIAAVVRDWLAASRHAMSISAVRQAHPRHGGAGALYIVLKR
jgi:DNA-nicking Smr family endonuclease